MAGGHDNPLAVKRGKPLPIQFYFDVFKRWTPSLMRFGAFGGCMFLYFSDWQVFMRKMPFYGKKFEPKDNITW